MTDPHTSKPPTPPFRRLVHPEHHRRTTSIVVLAAAVVVLAAALTLITRTATGAGTGGSGDHSPARQRTLPSASISPAASVGSPVPAGSTGQQRMREVADRVERAGAAPADQRPGPYMYLLSQEWDRATTMVASFEFQRWWRPDGSGRIITRRLPDRPNLNRPPTRADSTALAAARPDREEYQLGRLAPEVAGPLATTPDGLAAQFARIAPPENGPLSLITATVNVNSAHYLGQATRAATLRLLATIPRLQYRGTTRDIVGRPGLTWSLDLGSSTHRLTFHPTTGELMAYHEAFNTTPPSLFTYRLYLTRDQPLTLPSL